MQEVSFEFFRLPPLLQNRDYDYLLNVDYHCGQLTSYYYMHALFECLSAFCTFNGCTCTKRVADLAVFNTFTYERSNLGYVLKQAKQVNDSLAYQETNPWFKWFMPVEGCPKCVRNAYNLLNRFIIKVKGYFCINTDTMIIYGSILVMDIIIEIISSHRQFIYTILFFMQVLNGLLCRDNQKEGISIPIGIIPAGSDNSLVWTVLGVRDPVSAALSIVKVMHDISMGFKSKHKVRYDHKD